MKTNKSFTKRLKFTKKGKILARKPGFNHFNAKQSGQENIAGKRLKNFRMKNKIKSFLVPFN